MISKTEISLLNRIKRFWDECISWIKELGNQSWMARLVYTNYRLLDLFIFFQRVIISNSGNNTYLTNKPKPYRH